jgi:hypothetical protein
MFRNRDENFLDDGLQFSKLRFYENFPQKIRKSRNIQLKLPRSIRKAPTF